MRATIAIVGCLDTKGDELAYVRDLIRSSGHDTWIIDTGIIGEPALPADTSREEVAIAGGSTLEVLRARNDRGEAVSVMASGAAAIVRRLWAASRIDAVFAAGGSANTTIGSQAMRVLPVGFPKMLVSTLASGNVAPYVDTKDITLMYSVVDIAGINRISARVLANAASAVVAMATESKRMSATHVGSRPLVAATMFGVTTPCVNAARSILEAAGYEVLVFHATGTGGRAMEGLIDDGYIAGVLDITTTELADELVGGVLSAGPSRLTAAGRAGIPQVVSTGAVDMVNFGPLESVPERFRGRRLHAHNSTITLMRTTPEECAEIGARIASRLNAATGPVRILLPLRGVSSIAVAGGVFHDAAADERCFQSIRDRAQSGIPVVDVDADINAPAFARASAEALLELLRAASNAPSPP